MPTIKTYLDHAAINWAILNEALIVVVKQRFIKGDLEVNFRLATSICKILKVETQRIDVGIYEQIEQTL